MRTELPEDWTSCFFLLLHVLTVALEPYVGVREVKSVLELGESSQHVAKVLGSHDAVDDLTQEVGMAVVTGVFFNHMHQHPTHRRASGTRFIAP